MSSETPTLSFLGAARRHPERIALVAEGRAYRYAELAPRVWDAIEWLDARGVRAGSDVVPVVASPDADTFLVLHALIELGIPFAPLSPRLTEPERETLRAALSSPRSLDPARDPLPAGRDTLVPAASPALPDDDRLLAVVFTAGTTAAPKGARLSRAAFAASAAAHARNAGWREEDRWLLSIPLSHVGGLSILTRCLLAGAAVVLPGQGDATRAVAESVERDRVTLVSLVPTQLKRLLDRPGGWRPPIQLRAILLGGGAARMPLVARAAAANLPVLTSYGLTEACSQVATLHPGETPSILGDCGEPLAGFEVRVENGNIQIRGAALYGGYLGEEGPRLTGDGWYDTGDTGEIMQGNRLRVLGRAGDRITSGGEKLHPLEVESALERCEGVAGAVVFGVPDETWGEVVAAAIVPQGSAPPADEVLANFARRHLAPWKRPRLVCFIESLPLTEGGKTDRARAARECRESLRALGA